MTKRVKDEPKGLGGRPSKYDPAFCDQIIDFCAEGYSLTAFAGSLGIARSTIQEWAKEHPEFSVACNAAKAAAAFKWEQRAGRVGEVGGGPGTAQVVMFQLKNMAPDDYREKVDHTLAGPDGGPMKTETISKLDLSDLTQDDRDALRAILVRRLEGSSGGAPGA